MVPSRLLACQSGRPKVLMQTKKEKIKSFLSSCGSPTTRRGYFRFWIRTTLKEDIREGVEWRCVSKLVQFCSWSPPNQSIDLTSKCSWSPPSQLTSELAGLLVWKRGFGAVAAEKDRGAVAGSSADKSSRDRLLRPSTSPVSSCHAPDSRPAPGFGRLGHRLCDSRRHAPLGRPLGS